MTTVSIRRATDAYERYEVNMTQCDTGIKILSRRHSRYKTEALQWWSSVNIKVLRSVTVNHIIFA